MTTDLPDEETGFADEPLPGLGDLHAVVAAQAQSETRTEATRRAPGPDEVVVRRDDLIYVLAHVTDEIHGSPDPAHWRLPRFREALGRVLAAAEAGPGEQS